jgi:hypothetical protein
VVSQATAPPEQFVVNVPHTWIKPTQAAVSWLPAASAVGPLHYTVVLDGRALPTPAGAFAIRLGPRGLGNGTHTVQVLATDANGQATLTPAAALRVAGSPPSVKLTRAHGGTTVVVSITAGPGVDTPAVSVSFGDGSHASRRTAFRHRYGHAGVYLVVVWVRDKLGNQGVVRRLVSVR